MTKNIGIPWCQRCSWAHSVFEMPEHSEPVSPCQTKHSIVLLVQQIPWSRTAIIQVLLRSLLEHQTMESGNNSILQFAKIKISTNCCFLAQIKLLQGAANAYTIERDPKFSKWFDSILIMDEREAHELSCQVAFHFESVFLYQFSNSLFINFPTPYSFICQTFLEINQLKLSWKLIIRSGWAAANRRK